MLEIKLVRSKEDRDKRYEAYEVGCYEVRVTTYTSDIHLRFFTVVNKERDGYAPDIYYNDHIYLFSEKKPEFTIQTTSYGALSAEETQKFIAAYQMAIEVVSVLTEKFLK